MFAGLRPQRRHPVRILEETEIEDEIGLRRRAVLEAKADKTEDELGGLLAAADELAQLLTQLVHVEPRRVDHLVGHAANRTQGFALLGNAFDDGSIRRERMRP